MRLEWMCASLLALTVFAACGGSAPPTQRMASAEAAIRGAQEIGATKEPRAALHLKLAQEQVEKAKRYVEDGQNIQADLALQRAQADAELALAIAREAQTVAEAKAAQADVDKLRGGQQAGKQTGSK
ncbi:MAG: DUF4398 domain-containing protein [Myxococcales bacterium]|nr:DUF4398 domain-containing protein [Myxococcales bacterium]MDD9970339.1 DUF4398 domain-containing protein [Myxococcales bacterium]